MHQFHGIFRQNALISRNILPKFQQSRKNTLISRIFPLVTGMYQNKILKLDIEILPREKTNTNFWYMP